MKPNGVIQRKLALLDDQVLHLQKCLQGISLDQFREDWAVRSMTERALQVSIEIVIDVSERLVAYAEAGPVATAAEAIGKCVTLGFLSGESPYKDMVGYRNLIVHEYERIDPEITYTLATQRLMDFRAFRDEIDKLTAKND